MSLFASRSCPPLLLAGLLTLLTAACTTLLGDDFEIVAGEGGSTSSGGTGGGGEGGSGGSGGGGGGTPLPPMSCAWEPGSLLQVEAMDQGLQWDHRLYATLHASSGNRLRVFVSRQGGAAPTVDLFTIDGPSPQSSSFPAYGVFDVAVVSPTKVAALVELHGAGVPGTAAGMIVVDENDFNGADAATILLHNLLLDIDRFQATFAPVGNGTPQTISDVAVAISYRESLVYQAAFAYWDGAAQTAVVFDDDPGGNLGEADYRFNRMIRDSSAQNHVFIGNPFDNGGPIRHFVLPDTVSDLVAPVRQLQDMLIGLRPRGDGSYLATLAHVVPNGTFDLLIGVIDEGDLTTFTGADLLNAGNVGTMENVPIDGTFSSTADSFIMSGHRQAEPAQIAILIGHSSGLIRANQTVPFPDLSIFPASFTIKGVATVVEGTMFDTIGGRLLTVFTVIDSGNGNAERLYYGSLQCLPQVE